MALIEINTEEKLDNIRDTFGEVSASKLVQLGYGQHYWADPCPRMRSHIALISMTLILPSN